MASEVDVAAPCESCGMPIPNSRYCSNCATAAGDLQPFDDRLSAMVSWRVRGGSERDTALASSLRHMVAMPAWRDHPALLARLGCSVPDPEAAQE